MIVDTTLAKGDARARLASATAEIHQRLHRMPTFEALQDDTITLDGYRALLLRLLGFHRPLEAALDARAAELAPFGLRFGELHRVARLEADLGSLHVAADVVATAPDAEVDLAARPVGWLFGALYVREGATLGGRTLARHLDRLLGDRSAGRTFLEGDAGDGQRWKRVCATLDRVADVEGLQAMVDGANDTFAQFERWTSGGLR